MKGEQALGKSGADPGSDEAGQTDVRRDASRSIAVADHIRNAVLDASLSPGERINEVHLARALGVSRTPTRAALHTLAAEGLVDYAPNRGFTVREFPLAAVSEAYEIRACLEGLACRLASERGLPDEQWSALMKALSDGDEILSHKVLTDADLAAYRAVNVCFHDALLSAARSRMLSDAVRMTLNMPGATHRHIVSFTHRDVRRRHDDHHRIFELVEAGEGWRAEALMREHVSGIRSRLSGGTERFVQSIAGR